MRRELAEIIEPFAADESTLFAVIYSIDGTPLSSYIKSREFIPLLEWAEKQLDALAKQIIEENLDCVELRLGREGILMRPISRSLILLVGISDAASLYKIRVDTESLRRRYD